MPEQAVHISPDQSGALILSTASFPPVEYFVAIMACKAVYVEACENFNKQTYRNRYLINSANGPLSQVIPVKRPHGQKSPVVEVAIDYDLPWHSQHWRTIFSAYNNSPFFLYYQDELKPFFTNRYSRLFGYNMESLRVLLKLLGINKPVRETPHYIKHYGQAVDLRYAIHPKRPMTMEMASWCQVFSEKHGFNARVSILDLLFNMGPESLLYLDSMSKGHR